MYERFKVFFVLLFIFHLFRRELNVATRIGYNLVEHDRGHGIFENNFTVPWRQAPSKKNGRLNLTQCSMFDHKYSLQPTDFHVSIGSNVATCPNSSSMISAIGAGTRVWESDAITSKKTNLSSSYYNTTWQKEEDNPSFFLPAKCNINLYSDATDFCRIANQFSHIVVLGDSLQRHAFQAMLMGFSANLFNGSNALINATFSESPIPPDCFCDGSFQNHCREFMKPNGWGEEFSGQELCGADADFKLVFRPQTPYDGNPLYDFGHNGEIDCAQPDYKGMLVLANGGLHLKSRAHEVFQKFILNWFNHPGFRKCTEHEQMYFIWNSYHAHSPSNAAKYKFQSRERALYFNAFLRGMLDFVATDVIQVDWFNLSKGAQTTDGLHFKTNVNWYKATYLLQIANLMKSERRFQKLPMGNITMIGECDMLNIHHRHKHLLGQNPYTPGAINKWASKCQNQS